jgi:Uma2 family endonuclease
MAQYEIVLPESKPETEWVRGRPLQKEWRFRVAPGGVRRPLVPDVAYVSNERLRTLSDEELEIPPLAPNVAVEILSPCHPELVEGRRADVDDKIAVYLQAGSSLVIVVDPQQRAVELHDAVRTVRLDETSTIAYWALPEFAYPVRELFGVLRRS